MKKLIFGSINGIFWVNFALILVSALAGCTSTPATMFITSSGIVTYDRHTGKFEMLWENSGSQSVVVHDTVYIDSISSRKM